MQLYRVQSMADFAAVASGNPASAQEQRLVSAPLQMASSENTEHRTLITEHRTQREHNTEIGFPIHAATSQFCGIVVM